MTDRDATRYLMLVEEAVQLVLQASVLGGPGEVLILDMGTPVRIDDVARRLASQVDPPLDIIYTGLRSGEKLHEHRTGADERAECRLHPLISHVAVPPLDPSTVPRCGELAIDRAATPDTTADHTAELIITTR